ncbi:MAG: class I SAM-dependent methyltransferase [Planctomycetaceae bacterium]|nr:class I SAM-dependent methyltransferase [Planctomycetaceae bacterium]
MSVTTQHHDRVAIGEDDLRAIRTTVVPARDGASTAIDVADVIQEMMRPGDQPTSPRNYLNPRIEDVRHLGRDDVVLSPCPVCDGITASPTFEIQGLPHELATCTDCGLGRLHPLPSPEELGRFYPSEYYGSPGAKFEPMTEAVVRFVGTLHVQSLSRKLKPGSRILDVGCGRGVLLSSLADRGHEVHGMDVSETAVAGADPRADIRVAPCITKVGYPSDHFDQVILWHVVEHLTNPREVLSEINRILKPGGQVIVAVPNFSSWQARWSGAAWFHLDLPRHLFHFPLRGLRQILTRTDFTVTREQHFSLRQNPFGWVQSTMNKWDCLPRNALYNLLHNYDAGTNSVACPWRQRALRAAYLTGMPIAGALSLLSTVARSGASVCLVGRAN